MFGAALSMRPTCLKDARTGELGGANGNPVVAGRANHLGGLGGSLLAAPPGFLAGSMADAADLRGRRAVRFCGGARALVRGAQSVAHAALDAMAAGLALPLGIRVSEWQPSA